MDGTRIKAVNNKNRNFTRATLTQFIKAADAKLEDYLQRLDKRDANESGTGGSRVENLAEKITAIWERRERHKDMLTAMDRPGVRQISLTDPDSRAMAANTMLRSVTTCRSRRCEAHADHEQKVIKQLSLMGLLAQTAEPANEVLGLERIAVVASGAISRSRTLRPARSPGSLLTCHVRCVGNRRLSRPVP